ncbi:MAG: type 2 isopentenyl-diphosphate Delta-isomerase [Bacillota bacterium]
MEHLDCSSGTEDGPLSSGFDDVHLIHRALSDVDARDIALGISLWGRALPSPFLIDALTGGPPESVEINASLARAARRAGWGLSVGSQRVGLEDEAARLSFTIVRDANPDGLVLANLSAGATPEQAMVAVEMVAADLLQLHLNLPQELLMPEGERRFRGTRRAIRRVVEECPVPVVAKEVGFGVSAETAADLIGCKVAGINVAGAGGSNFAGVEMSRTPSSDALPVAPDDFTRWGIPTAISLTEVATVIRRGDRRVRVIAGGGIRSPLDAVRALVLGADMVSVAASAWRVLRSGGVDDLERFLLRWNRDARHLMLLAGAPNVSSLSTLPYVITGHTREYLQQRGFPTAR